MTFHEKYDNVDALGTAKFFANMNKHDKAKEILDMVKPFCFNFQQYDAIGKIYSDIREFKDALEFALKMHSLAEKNQDKWDIRTNIVRQYLNLNQPENALIYININEKLNPQDHANRMDKAMAYFLLNRKNEGESILRQILTEPHTDDIDFRIKFNLGTYDLANGNFKDGLRHVLLDGRKLNIWETYDQLPRETMWEGGIQPGKTILMAQEGGIGDEIISVRFQKHFRERGMHPIWYTNRKDLAEIFRRNGFEVITDLKQYRPEWLWCYSMPSPTFLDLEEDDLWYGPYIKPIRKAEKLPGKLKIGLKCMGNPKYDQDLNRTVPFEEVLSVLPEDATIYSFHIDEDLKHPRLVSLRDKIKTWDDTLDFIDQMDYMVSSCTSTAHAASAMGKRTTVFVPILNYYTWARPTKHSKWYSENTTVFRQTTYKNWHDPIREFGEAKPWIQ